MKIEDAIQSTFTSSQQKAIVNIRYTSNFLSGIQNGFMGKYDLTMAQFNILRILRGAKEPIHVNAMKQRMIEKSPNTTRLLDKLEGKELIKRCNCEADKRVVYVEITKEGLVLLEEIDEALKKENFFHNNLTGEEAETLSLLLDKLRTSAGN